MLVFQMAIWSRQEPFCFLMSSDTGRLSTTSHRSVDGAPSFIRPIIACLAAISSDGQIDPVGT